ncbi:uncharacterized protein LOC110707475 [Chenopodium quinoa]|uniref:uncharacterized protein LOC110707475 n=1 Tax=Chenopodium quinoa TaxID=63459 RepID=UPI000B7961CB|nr:uncharacterized protein LOC110707475 [Chenopodium quinoa]
MEMAEIKSKGLPFFWSNKAHVGSMTCTRIDRGLVNQAWIDQYGHVEDIYLPPSLSDHTPLLFEVFPYFPGKARTFRFLNCLTSHKKINSSVQAGWQTIYSSGAMKCIWTKLKLVKEQMKKLNTEHFSNIDSRINNAHNYLLTVQNFLASNYDPFLILEEAECIQKIKYWGNIQENIYKKKSRSQVLLKKHDEIKQEITGFYKNLMRYRAPSLPAVDLVTLRKGKQLSKESQQTLIAPITTAEIDTTLKGIDTSKAPGIDRFNSFFQKAWHIVKYDVYAAILEFFDTARLARVVGEVVDDAKAGFIPRKHICDNIFLATELIKGYTNKFITSRCMVKVDHKKAYDSIEWSYLRKDFSKFFEDSGLSPNLDKSEAYFDGVSSDD